MIARWVLWIAALGGVILEAQRGFAQVGGAPIIHDPSRIIKEGSVYYVFLTGLGGQPNQGIYRKSSRDRFNWLDKPQILTPAPDWTGSEVPSNDGTFWAPEIIKYGDEYRLYYSVSSFGSQDSAIGLATNRTLNDADPNYEWIDKGRVIDSEVGYPYNAIDPSVFVDADNHMWMTFGSFWQGIYITELNPGTGKPFSQNPLTTKLAANPVDPPNAIEAPYIHYRDGYYYLFVNWGSCCQGVNSTYEIRVGRSTSPTGPYFDKDGGPSMAGGGGTLFLGTEGNFIGPGHMSVFSENGVDYFAYHYYDGNDGGVPKFNIEQLEWTADGWPIPATDVIAGDFNGDLIVNADDLEVWEAYYGTTTDGLDFLDWQINVGSSLLRESAVTVPEPNNLLLFTLVGYAFFIERHRRRKTA